MATNVGVRALTRRGVRIGTQVARHNKTIVVDLDSGAVRRDLNHHASIGQVVVVAANNAFQNPGDGSATTLPANNATQTP